MHLDFLSKTATISLPIKCTTIYIKHYIGLCLYHLVNMEEIIILALHGKARLIHEFENHDDAYILPPVLSFLYSIII